jgi:hypothetical protein
MTGVIGATRRFPCNEGMGPTRSGRTSRERRTIEAMIRIYCRDRHGRRRGLCGDCERLRAYAEQRLIHCPFGAGKPTCANCTVHCYRADMRQAVREVMRYAGPRMVSRHPILAILHLWVDSTRKTPGRPVRHQPSAVAARARAQDTTAP